jgi:hypothetical protein
MAAMPVSIGHAIMIALPECRVECNLSVEHLLGKLSGLPQDDAALPEQAIAEAVLRAPACQRGKPADTALTTRTTRAAPRVAGS